MTERPRPVTIADVARRAGVSTATVSRVLAGIGHPRPTMVAAVHEAVAELDYRPSSVARSLRTRRTRTLGLIVTDIRNPFFPEMVQAADEAARGRGYSILLGSAAYDEGRAMDALNLMVDSRVDGLIVATSQLSDASWAWLADSPVPVVVANAEPREPPLTVVVSDNRGGARLATEHLLGLGHRRIAWVRGLASFTADEPRVAGFREACRAAGLSRAAAVELRGDGQVGGGERIVGELLDRHPDVTAIACHNDLTAIGVLRALRAAGRQVPGDVSVVGCDDIAAASWVVPALTTVGQQKTELGRIAVDRLVSALDDPASAPGPATIRLPMTLQGRESTGPAARVSRSRRAAPDGARGG
jgi:DNA-binding LacI/PurR family transcriptional regulator